MQKVNLSLREKMRLIIPYAYHNIKEQMLVVVPVCLYIVLFQVVILRYPLMQVGFLTGGIVLVFLGLAFFLEGIRIGLVPIGEIVGNTLPKQRGPVVILLFAFFLGILASIGEPVLGTLQMAGAQLKPEHAPLLYTLLVGKPIFLVATVSLGVGIAVVIGTLRFLYGWSLKPIILPLLMIGIALTLWAASNDMLASAIGLAWDTGAVIVGPVLCPLVLALGLGVCRASGKTSPSMAGFGMVGLISVVPIAAVVILTFVLYGTGNSVPAHKNHNLETSVTEKESRGAQVTKLPKTLDFEVYYPRLRQLELPSDLPYEGTVSKVQNLENSRRELFSRIYEVSVEEKSIRLKQSIPVAARKDAPALLATLGVDAKNKSAALFREAYQIRVVDEEKNTGTMVLRPEVPESVRRHIPEILKSMGHMEVGPLLIESLVLGARAILPIFLFLFVIMLLLKRKGPPLPVILLSLVFMVLGLGQFFFGLSLGLGTLGNQVGSRLPAAFLDFLPLFPHEASLYPSELGKIIVVVFAVILGYGATLAEPAFNVLGQQVEDVTQGAFKKTLFSQSVALGVGIGAGLGIASLLYHINLLVLLLPPYILLAILTVVNKEMFVNIAWDGGAVTTGPVTVPLKLAIGLSLSMATGAGEGFGVLALASAYPVLNILLLGLFLGSKKPKSISVVETADV